jgi:toxin ParE1/3/4
MIFVWLPTAIKNRHALIDHIAEDNLRAAIEHDERIEKQIDQLLENPEIGRAGRRKGTRELVISRTPFIVVYRIKAKRIVIVRLLHTSQAWPA